MRISVIGYSAELLSCLQSSVFLESAVEVKLTQPSKPNYRHVGFYDEIMTHTLPSVFLFIQMFTPVEMH